MRLWTEYEGETIDGAFPLKRLLLPEGRSAFFSTANGKGDPALLRLIECHFDEEEILARWRCVEALCHPNFLKLERFGQIELDGGPAVYALFEKADANLGEVLAQDRLSVKDVAQLAGSLVAALEMLHTHGFVHEHVQPQNIFAVGETVKLRSDCIREAPEGQAGIDAKRRDIHDLAMVLLQALTQTTDPERVASLSAPFDKIVRNGMNGAWGLTEMRAALEGRVRSSSAAVKPEPLPAAPKPAVAESTPPTLRKESPEKPPLSPSKPEKADEWTANAVRSSIRQEIWEEVREGKFSLRSKWTGVAAMVVILLLIGWLAAHEWHADRETGAQARQAAQSQPASPVQPVATPAQALNSPARVHAASRQVSGVQARSQWRVVAFTYNHQDQAQKKVSSLARTHPDLRPAVFTPTGRAPYLVTVGGVMGKEEAFALARKLRGRGLPRDTYAQNYNGNQR